MGRKPLNKTPEELRERKRVWEEKNQERIANYRRKGIITQSLKRGAMPSIITIDKYKFTREELQPIFDLMVVNQE